MKLRIVTTDPAVLKWKSLDAKLTAIATALNKTKNATWKVSIEYRDLTPEIVDGRITHAWFDALSFPLFKAGFEHVYLHFSMERWRELGLSSKLRGSNHTDTDYVGESYGRGNENTKRGRTGKNQFIQNVLHEMSHELHRSTGTPDRTHEYHDANPDISGIFATLDMAKWQPRAQAQLGIIATLKAKIAALKAGPQTLLHPFEGVKYTISQAYGVKSTLYPLTGRHIGTDYAVKPGTAIRAPWDGTITAAGTGRDAGNFCHFRYTFQGETKEERFCHLESVPKLGNYRRGAVIAYSGNTGLSTGPHTHRERWKDAVALTKITKVNWALLTEDPEK